MSWSTRDAREEPERPSLLFGRRRKDASADSLVTATPSDVWNLVSDPEKIHLWWPRALGGVVKSGEEIGREQIIRLDWGRREGRVTQIVHEWEPGARYGWKVAREFAGDSVLNPIATIQVSITMRPELGRTRVSIAGHFEPIGSRGLIAVRQLIRSARITYRKALRGIDSQFQRPIS
ncbi:MAG: SRPBCC family protein [Actinomycetota bacterium]